MGVTRGWLPLLWAGSPRLNSSGDATAASPTYRAFKYRHYWPHVSRRAQYTLQFLAQNKETPMKFITSSLWAQWIGYRWRGCSSKKRKQTATRCDEIVCKLRDDVGHVHRKHVVLRRVDKVDDRLCSVPATVTAALHTTFTNIQFFEAVDWPSRKSSACNKPAAEIPKRFPLGTGQNPE